MYTGHQVSGEYYCFQKCSSGKGLPVEVFADHAVVFDWPNYKAFLISPDHALWRKRLPIRGHIHLLAKAASRLT